VSDKPNEKASTMWVATNIKTKIDLNTFKQLQN